MSQDPIKKLLETTAKLRDPDNGCPWNVKQTHQSLKRHLLEEAYEVLEAIDRGQSDDLMEELGDLLFQVVIHARIAQERGSFSFEDIAEHVDQKMIRRHPHVFGQMQLDDDNPMPALDQMWEQVKAKEKTKSESPFSGIPSELPSLARALKVLKKADKQNIDAQHYINLIQKRVECDLLEIIESEDDVAGLLVLLANHCKQLRIDPEDILRREVLKLQKYLEAKSNG